jgi:ABC-type phosphate/phosphonate transport system substrate-binding protein
MTTLTLTYYPDITQKQTAEDVRSAIVVFADSLAAQLSADLGTEIAVEVAPVQSVIEQYEHILRGESHIALMRPVAYVFAHKRDEQILPACVAYRLIDGKVGTTYFAQLYARRDLEISSLADLVRRSAGTLTIAYGDRFSTSNFLIPASTLRLQARIHPFLFFKRVVFTGGHDLAAEAVYQGDADIGAGHDGVIKILSEEFPDAENRIVRLAREDIHSDPVVVHAGILPEPVSLRTIQQACTAVAKTEPVKAALDLFWGWAKDLGPTEHANYASIERAIEALHLTEADMLG